MLTEDQRALNGLLFARRMAERLRREEYENSIEHGVMRTTSLEGLIDNLEREINSSGESDQANSARKE